MSAPLVIDGSGLRWDNVRNVLKVGKSAQHLSPAQSTGDEVEALPMAVKAIEDAFLGGVELVDPLDGAPVSCNVGRQPPVPGCLAGAEHKLEGGLKPSQDIGNPACYFFELVQAL